MLSDSTGSVHKDEHSLSPRKGQVVTESEPIWEDLNTKLNMLRVQAEKLT